MLLAAILSVLMVLPAQAPPQQDPSQPREKPPQEGDAVIVKGCVKGSVLESHETRKADDTGMTSASIDYRMTGKKDVVKAVRSGHDGHLEEITGVLKSRLPDDNVMKGKQIGKTRIFIGGDPRSSGIESRTPHLPVLEVKSSRHLGDRCGL